MHDKTRPVDETPATAEPLMSLWTLDESLVAACDENCYEASTPRDACDCLCGGNNHGVGLATALEQTRAHSDDWIQAYARKRRLTDFSATTVVEPEACEEPPASA